MIRMFATHMQFYVKHVIMPPRSRYCVFRPSDKTDKVVKVDLQYILPTSSPVVELDASAAFEGLSKQERLYAHYLSRASWYGGLICFLQVN